MNLTPDPRPPASSRPPFTPRTIGEAEAHLAAIERERQQTLETLARLRAGSHAPRPVASPMSAAGTVPLSTTEKVALFRRYFRGRDDLYPRLWENRRTGRKGYAPACGNEWAPGLCEKPRVKCGACANKAFLPLTDDVVPGHLRGQHVVGIYPLLTDESCWLLAADFDEGTWREDAQAFRDSCHDAGIAVTLERSRSGNGAHAWLFFSEPVPAAVARRMGCHLLTETMNRRHELSLASYDRLFPSQDTLPAGGFGNLIALPLQHAARRQGNTLFLNADLEPYADPWAYLAGVTPTPPSLVEEVAARAARDGRTFSIPLPAEEESGEGTPWVRPPSRPRHPPRLEGPPPAAVHAVAAQRIFVEKASLPSPLLSAIKRLAAFQNPQFYQRQGMRLSTALTPRVIGCAEESPLYIGRLCLPGSRAGAVGSVNASRVRAA